MQVTTAPKAEQAPRLLPRHDTEIFPMLKTGMVLQTNDAYIEYAGGARVPLPAAAHITELGPDGVSWEERGSNPTGSFSLDASLKQLPGTKDYQLHGKGTWAGNPYEYQGDYGVTQAKLGLLELTPKFEGASDKPSFYKMRETGDVNKPVFVEVQVDLPPSAGGGRLFRSGYYEWADKPAPAPAK